MMTIKINDQIPDVNIKIATNDGPIPTKTSEIFIGEKVALFAVPGAFTPTCSAKHLPSFMELKDELKAKGITKIVCLSVNDGFVMQAWAKSQDVNDEITMIADGSAEFTKALGLEMDASAFGMGIRSQRFALVADNGKVTHLFIEAPGEYKVSSAQYMLENI